MSSDADVADTSVRAALTPPLTRMLAGIGASAFGGGLTMALFVVYLHAVRDVERRIDRAAARPADPLAPSLSPDAAGAVAVGVEPPLNEPNVWRAMNPGVAGDAPGAGEGLSVGG